MLLRQGFDIGVSSKGVRSRDINLRGLRLPQPNQNKSPEYRKLSGLLMLCVDVNTSSLGAD